MQDNQLIQYSRHILLNEIDIAKQQKILTSTALVIGCGGLGNATSAYLVAAGIGKLIIVDDDQIELSNLQRQVQFSLADIGQNKALTLKNRLQQLNADCQIMAITTRLSSTNLTNLIPTVDIVVDCTDNHPTRMLINQACSTQHVNLVIGAAIKFVGQISCYNFADSTAPCYSCLFPHESNPRSSCANEGVFAPLVGIIGAAQANEALKILANIGHPSFQTLWQFNALDFSWQKWHFNANPHCSICHA